MLENHFMDYPKMLFMLLLMLKFCKQKRDINEAKKVFDVISKKSGSTIWKNFLIVLSQLLPSGDPDLVNFSNKAVELFPSDKEIFSLKSLLLLDNKRLMKPIQFQRLVWIILIKNYMLKLLLNLRKHLKLII